MRLCELKKKNVDISLVRAEPVSLSKPGRWVHWATQCKWMKFYIPVFTFYTCSFKNDCGVAQLLWNVAEHSLKKKSHVSEEGDYQALRLVHNSNFRWSFCAKYWIFGLKHILIFDYYFLFFYSLPFSSALTILPGCVFLMRAPNRK